MPTLYTYCIPKDKGSAPNPFWGVCTLAICKPRIRKQAQIGDWIVGFGSKESPIGDISGKVVYAMKVTAKKTMEEYDSYTKECLEGKIPDLANKDRRRWYGNSIYDFTTLPPLLREGVHSEKNRKKDLGGTYVLISEYFFYFGNQPITLPNTLSDIVVRGRADKWKLNEPHFYAFVSWIENLSIRPNILTGEPQMWSRSGKQPLHEIHSDECQSECDNVNMQPHTNLGKCS